MSIECTCEKCQACCAHKPGWFKPGEAEQVAKFFGITLKELFGQKLMVDWWVGGHNIFLLSPAIVGSEGSMAPANPIGRCVFFKEGRCEIHPVKPFECRNSDCQTKYNPHKDTAMAWPEHQAQLGELLGREPVSEAYTIFDMLGIKL